MTLKNQIQADEDVFYDDDDFAETVMYNTQSSSDQILALVNRGENLKHETNKAKITSTVWVKRSDITQPTYKDTVVFDSYTWIVEKIDSGGLIDWKVSLRRGSKTKFR
jgi:hypothetical protein